MFERPTVVVVGAGASAELKFPVGSQLKYQIADYLHVHHVHGNLRCDERLRRAFFQLEREVDFRGWIDAANSVSRAMPVAESIDNFLFTHSLNPRFERCGKLAITATILDAERRCALYKERDARPDLAHRDLRDCWLNRFCNRLFVGATADTVDRLFENLTFVIFNYDRCVETYLLEALVSYFSIDRARAAAVLSLVTFYHPYGTVGRLPWQEGNTATSTFGGDGDDAPIISLAEGIRTFTETIAEDGALATARQRFLSAAKVIFLGFSFASQNMSLLRSAPALAAAAYRHREVFGTAFGVSEEDRAVYRHEVIQSFPVDAPTSIVLQDLTCSALFDRYSRSIAA